MENNYYYRNINENKSNFQLELNYKKNIDD